MPNSSFPPPSASSAIPTETLQTSPKPMPLARLWDAIALTRPTLLVPLWTLQILGAAHARMYLGDDALVQLPTLMLLRQSAFHTLIVAGAYVLNQLTDVETDAANGKLFLIADGHVSRRFAYGWMIALFVVGLLGGSLLAGSWVMTGVLLASGVLSILYSMPPLRLKARPVLDLLANSIGFGGLAFFVGWLAVTEASWAMCAQSLPYVIAVAATFVLTTVPDIAGDRVAGLLTTGVALGQRAAMWVAVGLLAAGIIVSVVVSNWVALAAMSVSMPIFLLAVRSLLQQNEMKTLLRATQSVILLLSACAMIFVPAYGLWLVVLIGWVRWYYARRFGIRYP